MTKNRSQCQLEQFLSVMVAIIGATVIIGWYLQIPLLLRIHPSFAPMQFNTALGMFLSGLAIFALLRSKLTIAYSLAVGVLLMGGLTLWEILTTQNLGIDQIFLPTQLEDITSKRGRMAPTTAMCFCIEAIAILVLASAMQDRLKTIINSILSSTIIALAFVSLVGYILEYIFSYHGGVLTTMAIHTASCFAILGLILFLQLPVTSAQRILPIISIVLVVLVVLIWLAMREIHVISVQEKATDRAMHIQRNWNENITITHKALQRMINRLDHDNSNKYVWHDDAEMFMTDFQFLVMVRRLHDGTFSVVGDSTLTTNVLSTLPPNPCQIAKQQTLQFINNPQDDADIFMAHFVTLPSDDDVNACIFAISSLRRYIGKMRQDLLGEIYPMNVTWNNRSIFHESSDGIWSAQAVLKPEQANLSLSLTPTKAQFEAGHLPEIMLAIGLLLDGLILFLFYWWRVALDKAHEAKIIQEQLQENLVLYSGVLTNAPYGIVLIDHLGVIELVNPALEQLFGYTRNELVGKSIETLIPFDLHGAHIKQRSDYQNNAGIAKKMATQRQVFGLHSGGEHIAVEVNIASVNSARRQGVMAMAMVVDVRERLQSQRKITEQNERFTMASNAAAIGFWDFDIPNNTLQWDEQMYRLYGRQPSDGDQPYSLWSNSLHPDDRAMSEQHLNDAINGIRAFDTEFRIIHPDGSIHVIKAMAAIVRDANGEALKMFGINADITERKLIENKQIAYANELARINAELSSFTYIASHDLKSPLRGIDQLATWITEDLGDELSKDTAEHLHLMRRRIYRMEMLLDDLLAYSRVGRSDGDIILVNTHNLLENIFDLTSTEKKIQLVLADNLPTFETKKVPLELVFRNLIGNAIKHHDKEQGNITVSAQATTNGYEFTVCDDGPGIPLEHQQRVFAMFQTLKPRDEVEGSGIGLAIVKKSVDTMGGKITLESDGHHGCTFRFTWPTIIKKREKL